MVDQNFTTPGHLHFCIRKAIPFLLGILLVVSFYGCARTTTGFMKIGEKKYPTKPKDYEVLVFAEDETPQREYQVIGMVYTTLEDNLPSVNKERIITRLKQEAKKHGADAILDIKLVESSGYLNVQFGQETPEYVSGEAKAIVFK